MEIEELFDQTIENKTSGEATADSTSINLFNKK
nr:MAG TPA: hypothetical protein [Microviridae sp.]